MSYVHKIIGTDETLIGIARLHWIYIIQGLIWFFALAGIGWLMDMLMTRGLMAVTASMDRLYVPEAVLGLGNGVMLFMMGAGFLIFLMYVIKVISTKVALTDRRVIHKSGLIFVNAHNVDLEEIRGENLDLGYFGRILGYGYLLLDCRFLGDIRLPAIENPERFLRALHNRRANAQDALNLVIGKSGSPNPVTVNMAGGEEQKPEVAPPKPEPEITNPDIPNEIPTPPNQPMPNQPPPLDQDAKKPAAAKPSKAAQVITMLDSIVPKPEQRDEMKAPPSLEQARSGDKSQDDQNYNVKPSELHQPQQQEAQPPQPVQQAPVPDPAAIAKIVEQVTPQIAQQVVREMTEQGLINQAPPEPENDKVDNNLIHVFDEAALDKDDLPHDINNKVEYAIH